MVKVMYVVVSDTQEYNYFDYLFAVKKSLALTKCGVPNIILKKETTFTKIN